MIRNDRWRMDREPPELTEKCEGIDGGILSSAHGHRDTAVESLGLAVKRGRLERDHRNRSRTLPGTIHEKNSVNESGSATVAPAKTPCLLGYALIRLRSGVGLVAVEDVKGEEMMDRCRTGVTRRLPRAGRPVRRSNTWTRGHSIRGGPLQWDD